jgi:polysaccharide pyruvyl transferase WcaK-like protein
VLTSAAMPCASRVSARPRTRISTGPPRIGVLYPSGWGNLGDEAILQATFVGLRRLWPDAELRAFTLHPERTARNHGVEAEPLTGVNRPMFHSPLGDGPWVVRASRALAHRSRPIPLAGKMFRAAADLTAALAFEPLAVKSAWRWLRTADLVLAAGGGQIDATWGGTWGQPYALARWAFMARRARVPFAFLSVGFGTVSSWLSRRFMRYAVTGATYVSMRDAGSRSLTLELGVCRDLPVVPDLAFSLETGSPLAPRRPGYDIGISPMVYLRPSSWPREDRVAYERIVGLWADMVSARVSQGDRVHLFVSDPGDISAVREVWAKLDDRARAGCSVSEAETPGQLMEFYRGLDVAISSRLHGVLLALAAGRPVLALSHERKVRAVMSDAGAGEFCRDLTTATLDQVEVTLASLLGRLDECAEAVRTYAGNARTAIRQQEEFLPQLLKASL